MWRCLLPFSSQHHNQPNKYNESNRKDRPLVPLPEREGARLVDRMGRLGRKAWVFEDADVLVGVFLASFLCLFGCNDVAWASHACRWP